MDKKVLFEALNTELAKEKIWIMIELTKNTAPVVVLS